jgi:tellurite resistance protein TehA-like permease
MGREAWARLRRGLRDLHPASFAFVMATGIVSTAEAMFGHQLTSTALLLVAGVGYSVLCGLYLLRASCYPSGFWADTGRPERAFGFFTFVAGSNVLAVRLALAGQWGGAEALAVLAGLAWLALSYGILARVAFASVKPPPGEAINGSWLIWVVATQSLSIALSVLGMRLGLSAQLAGLTAISLWAFGALLYLLLMAIILARLLLLPLDPAQASPPYWVSMGATAITVFAGAQLLRLPASLPSVVEARSTVAGFSLFLWAFGSWWIPFLVLLTIWRYLSPELRVYEQTLWSMVFPLGMYAVATDAFAEAAHLPLLKPIAAAEVWLALLAWAAVAAWMVISWIRPGWPAGLRRPALRSPSARG